MNEYTEAVNDELKLLKQKAKVKWLKESGKTLHIFMEYLKQEGEKNRVKSICYEEGNRYDGNNVAAQFFKNYEYFLGTLKPVIPIMEDIFRNTLSNDDAMEMVKEVTEKEIKETLFDSDSDKAYGPDGYTSEFF
nr:hypothetical protein [Tanacetum cinerariifolium]